MSEYYRNLSSMTKLAVKLEKQVAILKKCVEFYANENNWYCSDEYNALFENCKPIRDCIDDDSANAVCGKLARETLIKINEV